MPEGKCQCSQAGKFADKIAQPHARTLTTHLFRSLFSHFPSTFCFHLFSSFSSFSSQFFLWGEYLLQTILGFLFGVEVVQVLFPPKGLGYTSITGL